MQPSRKSSSSENKNISINGDVKDSAVFIGDNNTVNQTIIQKFFNIFKSDSETTEQRNRRILLGHVENAWIKGVLDASLHGEALLDLGIKPDPEAVTKYPWAIKKESTDETLPAGTSMLEIFDSIGMGRSLLILGAPGSGKTTMLLELARQLIARAREDITYPIPMVFNLASWTEEKQILNKTKNLFNKKSSRPDFDTAPFANWLVSELNSAYLIPQITAQELVKENKLLLLLDGLDEVRQDSRAKCVEAINLYRKEHGLTSLAVCSRSQDYADLNAKLSFEGAIEVQPLTQEQITEFFNRFGDKMAGIKQVLKKDSALREMAETPLFLSIMIMAYRDKRDVEILVSGDEKARRKHLFDTYIERIFERPERSKNENFKKLDVLRWLSWMAQKMTEHNAVPYLLENMQPMWITQKKQLDYKLINWLFCALSFGAIGGLVGGLSFGMVGGLVIGLIIWLIGGWIFETGKIEMVDVITWDWRGLFIDVLAYGTFGVLFVMAFDRLFSRLNAESVISLSVVIVFFMVFWLIDPVINKLSIKPSSQITFPMQRILSSIKNFFIVFLLIELIVGLFVGLFVGLLVGLFVGLNIGLNVGLIVGLNVGLFLGLIVGLFVGLRYGGGAVIQHYSLYFIIAYNNLLPWRLVPFLNHCVDLIFLRRVGGGYIFVHRLLMEHFAEMYVETPTSKGN